jgi:hypothetical protein
LELFPTSHAALKWQDYLRLNAEPDERFDENIPVLYQGRQLLDLLSYLDIVEFIDGESNCTSHYLTQRAIRVRASHKSENTLKIANVEELLACMRSRTK